MAQSGESTYEAQKQAAAVDSMPEITPIVDIAVNLTDCVFHGVGWNGKRLHDDDFAAVLSRARAVGVTKMIVSGTSIDTSRKAIALCRSVPPGFLYCTVGVHPAHCTDFLKRVGGSSSARDWPYSEAPGNYNQRHYSYDEAYMQERLCEISSLIDSNRDVVVAFGEFGLDYTELKCCPKDVQLQCFERQLALARDRYPALPLFLHCRDASNDFFSILDADAQCRSQRGGGDGQRRGVVHSFASDVAEELAKVLSRALHVGVNGSAFRTETSARLAASVPLDRLLIESDAPWCDIRPAHYGYRSVASVWPTHAPNNFVMGHCVEKRNEPCHVAQVLQAYLGAVRQFGSPACPVLPSAVARQLYRNAERLFWTA